MVVFDLLDIGGASPAPTHNANVSSNLCSSGGSSALLRHGDVVLAKYGKSNRFYWAKVAKVYKVANGESLCDVGWLRPQAGAKGGAAYVLHDGYDETMHGEGLKLASDVRRPCAADLTADAPPGASRSAAAQPSAPAPVCKQAEFADLLGEPSMDRTFDDASVGGALSSSSQPLSQAPFQAPLQASVNSSAGMALGGMTAQTQSWPNNAFATPWAGNPGVQAAPFAWNGAAPTAAAWQQRPVAPEVRGAAKPGAGAAGINELQASFAADLLPKSSLDKGQALNVKVPKKGEEKSFDFISDMMSGALTGVKSD